MPFGGGCIKKAAEATIEATFIIRVATAKYSQLMRLTIEDGSISLKGNVDMVGHFSECAVTAQYTDVDGRNPHLLLVLRRRVRSLKTPL